MMDGSGKATWRHAAWARWWGWTALYAAVVYGLVAGSVLIAVDDGAVLAVELVAIDGVALMLVYAIGTQFPLRAWPLGPLAALAGVRAAEEREA